MSTPEQQAFTEWLHAQGRAIQRIAVLTGAGISAESGIPTFRGRDGLWRGMDPSELFTPQALATDPELIWQMYDELRTRIAEATPNAGHYALAALERRCEVTLATQNIDGLHQRAGSVNVLELHGTMWRLRCMTCRHAEDNQQAPLPSLPPRCPQCAAVLRPDIVLFTEALPFAALEDAICAAENCDLMLVIGTSGVVYPAAGLPGVAATHGALVVEVNPYETALTAEDALLHPRHGGAGVAVGGGGGYGFQAFLIRQTAKRRLSLRSRQKASTSVLLTSRGRISRWVTTPVVYLILDDGGTAGGHGLGQWGEEVGQGGHLQREAQWRDFRLHELQEERQAVARILQSPVCLAMPQAEDRFQRFQAIIRAFRQALARHRAGIDDRAGEQPQPLAGAFVGDETDIEWRIMRDDHIGFTELQECREHLGEGRFVAHHGIRDAVHMGDRGGDGAAGIHQCLEVTNFATILPTDSSEFDNAMAGCGQAGGFQIQCYDARLWRQMYHAALL